MNTPKILNKMADVVLAYRPKPKSDAAKKRERKRKKAKGDGKLATFWRESLGLTRFI